MSRAEIALYATKVKKIVKGNYRLTLMKGHVRRSSKTLASIVQICNDNYTEIRYISP